MNTKFSHSLHPNRVRSPGAGDLGSKADQKPPPARPRARTRRPAAPASPGEAALDGGLRPVTLEYMNPAAQEVYLAGTFNRWEPHAIPMTRREDGSWIAVVLLPPGRHEYRVIVDGQWQENPAASQFTDNPFGGRNSILEVAALNP